MAESDNRRTVQILQKRLTTLVAGLGLFGCLALCLVWWDSTICFTHIFSGKHSLIIHSSAIEVLEMPSERNTTKAFNLLREYSHSEEAIFPVPCLNNQTIYIPIYLLILTYLATLLLIWLILMNRLARREFAKAERNPAPE